MSQWIIASIVAALATGVAAYVLTGGESTWVPLYSGLVGAVCGALASIAWSNMPRVRAWIPTPRWRWLVSPCSALLGALYLVAISARDFVPPPSDIWLVISGAVIGGHIVYECVVEGGFYRFQIFMMRRRWYLTKTLIGKVSIYYTVEDRKIEKGNVLAAMTSEPVEDPIWTKVRLRKGTVEHVNIVLPIRHRACVRTSRIKIPEPYEITFLPSQPELHWTRGDVRDGFRRYTTRQERVSILGVSECVLILRVTTPFRAAGWKALLKHYIWPYGRQ